MAMAASLKRKIRFFKNSGCLFSSSFSISYLLQKCQFFSGISLSLLSYVRDLSDTADS